VGDGHDVARGFHKRRDEHVADFVVLTVVALGMFG
jgi:hypothetical protein